MEDLIHCRFAVSKKGSALDVEEEEEQALAREKDVAKMTNLL